jgi:NADPH:quinone reductase-like Zn-dependent oxidoreductase
LTALYETGGIDPLVFREVDIEDAPAALELLAHRGTYGKVIIRP